MHPEFRQSMEELATRILAGIGPAAVRHAGLIVLTFGLGLFLLLTASSGRAEPHPGRAELRLRQSSETTQPHLGRAELRLRQSDNVQRYAFVNHGSSQVASFRWVTPAKSYLSGGTASKYYPAETKERIDSKIGSLPAEAAHLSQLRLRQSSETTQPHPGRAELRLRQSSSLVASDQISNPNRLSMVACAKCHGEFLNPESSQHRWQSAYQVWVSRDPHSDAYLTLRNNQSQQMVTALAQAAGKTPSATGNDELTDALYQRTINQRCVSCHSTVPASMSVEMNVRQSASADHLSMANGVGCLSCHCTTELDNPQGKDWIDAHTKKPWAESSTKEKTSLGLQDLTQHKIRAQTCIKCHVGSPGREVDHDLIAAGHPRLVFEYASHLQRLPKHWTEEKTDYFFATCWSIGQLESAKSALTLLKHRATSAAQGKAAWPEFTEYNCSSCHHDLGASWYLTNDLPSAGKPNWGTWVFPKDAPTYAMQGNLDALRAEMGQAKPDAGRVIQTASAIVPALRYPSPVDNLYFYIRREPRPNADEVWAWYLAVNCCIQDSLLDRAASEVVIELMLELETMLQQPFADSTGARPFTVTELLGKMSQIRQVVLPVLETNRNRPNQTP